MAFNYWPFDGTPGTPGSIWYNGTGAPSGGTGIIGDYYLDNATGNYYQKTGVATWTLLGTFTGGGGGVSSVGGLTGAVPGGLILLEQHTAAGSATLDFTASISATYDEYYIEILGIVPAGNQDLWMRVSTDGGVSYQVTNYTYILNYGSDGGSGGVTASASDTHILLAGSTLSGGAALGVVATIRLFNPLSTSLNKRGLVHSYFTISSGVEVQASGGIGWKQTTAINAFRFMAASGNLTSGIIRCYGVAKV